jgi:hypothetical protein
VPDNPGTWLFHCHVNDHMMGGMATLFTVNGETAQPELATAGDRRSTPGVDVGPPSAPRR